MQALSITTKKITRRAEFGICNSKKGTQQTNFECYRRFLGLAVQQRAAIEFLFFFLSLLASSHTKMDLRVGVDVGGTNTDAVVMVGDDVLGWAKTMTTEKVEEVRCPFSLIILTDFSF